MSRLLPRRIGPFDLRKPLDRVGSIKLKLGITIVLAVGVASVVTSYFGVSDGVRSWERPVVRIAVALLVVQVLTRGMTSPLREMASAARTMAAGGWGQRVTDTSADEVGELARAFNAMAAELAAVDRMRRDLIANVSHELRTPISALQARLENMVDGVEPPDPALLASMLEQTERLGRLVEQLLDLSRLESGAVPLHREEVEVAALLDAVAAEARLHEPGRRIDVAVTPADLRLDADPDRIHQVLANLTANALRHGPPDRPVTLTATLATADTRRIGEAPTTGDIRRTNAVPATGTIRQTGETPAAGTVRQTGEAPANGDLREDRGNGGCSHVVLTVTDEGPGIPAAEAERVFERFYRADAARPGTRAGTPADGAGLGLSIARWIVDLHGGDIRALPNEPTGCTVACRLPVHAGGDHGAPGPTASHHDHGAAGPTASHHDHGAAGATGSHSVHHDHRDAGADGENTDRSEGGLGR